MVAIAMLLSLTGCGGGTAATEVRSGYVGRVSTTDPGEASTAATEQDTAEDESGGTATEQSPAEDGSGATATEHGTAENGSGAASTEKGTAENTSGAASSEQGAEVSGSGTKNTDPDVTVSEMMLANLNIKHGAEGLDRVAEAILEISPDIIGLEEVDVNCERSGYVDEPAELARLAGYPYYAFAKAINLGDGEYGTAILSRYPIESFEVIPLDSGNGEARVLGHAVISVGDMELHAFVTHLSYQDRWLRIGQMESIASQLSTCDHYVLMGDFNCFDLEDIVYLGGAYYVNRPDRRFTTFPRYDMAIDNIVVSGDFTEILGDVLDTECSDHKMIYAKFHIG